MRLLANENFPRQAVEALREIGHDVLWIRTFAPGLTDQEVLSIAGTENRLLLTFDKDFGELAVRRRMPVPHGVILFRIAPSSALEIAQIAVAVLGSRRDWAGHFAVVEEDRIRMTPLPGY